MTDTELTRAFERGEIANQDFHHQSHLHVAWVYLNESSSADQAAQKMAATLRRFAAANGHPEKYHQTITRFWIDLLAHLRASHPGKDLSDILHVHPQLLEKNFTLDYYSRERLFSDRARIEWVEPDLKSIPRHATAISSSGPTRHSPHRSLS